ncbi:MAG TPA: alpha/beta fold hydrolase [Candidatus Aquilonibacter sp.]
MPRFRLFCIPYAGGWPSVFRPWTARLPADVELVAVRMPGRESRFAERPYTDWSTLTSDAAEALQPLLDVPFALFGHSFGGMLAYEIACVFNTRRTPNFEALIVSGCRCPRVQPEHRAPYDAPSDAFWTWLSEIDGTPAEVLANPQLREVIEPTLRADLKLADAWRGAADIIDLPIVSFGGAQDRIVPRQQIDGWRNFSARTYRHVEFASGHFFIHSLEAEVVAEISQLCQAA